VSGGTEAGEGMRSCTRVISERELAASRRKLARASEEELAEVTRKCLWLAVHAAAATGADISRHHDLAEACLDEARRRGKPELYQQALDAVYKEVMGTGQGSPRRATRED